MSPEQEYATILMHDALRLELLGALAAERRRNDDLRLADGQRWTDGQERIQAQLAAMAAEALRVNSRAETTAANLAIEQKATAATLQEKVESTARQASTERENSATVLRGIVETTAHSFEARIGPLETFRLENSGRVAANTERRTQANWQIGVIIAAIAASSVVGPLLLSVASKAMGA